MEVSSEKVNSKRKHDYNSMPSNIKSIHARDLIQSVSVLVKTIQMGGKKGQLTPGRIINTLVRGLGSSNIQVQKNYFATLVALLNSFKMSPEFSARLVMNAMESELQITGNISKGEEGEVLIGRVLVFGTLVRSGALTAAAKDDQVTAITQLLKDIKGKSYLPLTADPFIIEFLKQMDESVFKKAVWPNIRKEVNQGPGQSLLMYHLLLVCEERFPSVVSPKFLNQTLGSSQVCSTSTVSSLVSALKGNFNLKAVNHSAYSDVLKYIANSPEEVLQSFWQQVESQLLVDSNSSSNKQILAIKFFSLIVSQLQDASKVINLLTHKLLSLFMKKNKVAPYLQKIFNVSCREALENLYNLCKNADSSKTIILIIKKIVFDPGNILFEQLSGSKVIQQLMGHLKEKGVIKLATIFRDIIIGNSSAVECKDSETTTRPWHNKEKLYTVHLFCKLMSLSAIQSNMEWRLNQLTFLFDMGFFPTNIGVELAGHIRESFFSCLNHKLPNLEDLCNILAGIVKHITSRLDSGDQLRIKIPSEVMPAWKKMFATTKKIGEGKKCKKEQWENLVFRTMFFHIGLHLFKEAAFATDFLQELHSVYERVGSTVSTEEEPNWTEVVVEMFLSLLSRNSQLHRHLIGWIFSYFCPIMTPQNIHQILQVLDPNSNANPLLNSLDNDLGSSSEDEESDGDDNDEDDEQESSDDGMTDGEEEEEDEKVNDKLRRAVVEALGNTGAGALTDVESVDLDDMDEEEGAKVDKALSQAFKAIKQGKTKKQPSQAKALTHFRLRVLDLIEVWLASEPPLDLIMDTLLRLISLLEHSLVDRHQAPLEVRLRSVIRKLTATKKYDVSDCKGLYLGNILKSLLEKGNRTTTVYMSIFKELTASTLFIAKASQQVNENEDKEESTNTTVLSVLEDTVRSFFLQRDCLFTVALFEGLFKLNVPFIWNLASKLPNYAFDLSVHPFRRSKALEFLIIFWQNNRTLLEANKEHSDLLKKMSKRLHKGCVKMMEKPAGRVQPKFLNLLKKAFEVIRRKNWITDIDWPRHFQSLGEFQKNYVTKSDAKNWTKFNGNSDAAAVKNMEVEDGKENSEESQAESEGELEHVAEEETSSVDENDEEANPIVSEEEEKNLSKEDVQQESEESHSDSDKPTKKKPKKKRSHEKIQRTQLLKNNSKRLRLESMAVGLEENVFSKYKVLSDNAKPLSPER